MKIKNKLQNVPVPTVVMKQIGIDLCNLPEVDGYCSLVVCIDYFSKWSEAKPIKEKTAPTIAQFIYKVMCRHGCFSAQINDQGREFVNSVSDELHRLTGVQQGITSAYHPQANGMVERQNRTIKNSLVKVLNENPSDWPHVIKGVLFAHRVSQHSPTKFSPFQLLCNREPVLPIDIKHNISASKTFDPNELFDMDTFQAIIASTAVIRQGIHKEVEQNIKMAQQKQKRDFDKRHYTDIICVVDTVLLKNNKRSDRKGGGGGSFR